MASRCKACKRPDEAAWKVAHAAQVKEYQNTYSHDPVKASWTTRDIRRKTHGVVTVAL